MMQNLNLDEIKIGCPGLTRFKAGSLWESCIVTLSRQKHVSGQQMELISSDRKTIQLSWTQEIDEQLQSTYADQQEATEHAAECLAILLGIKLEGYTIIERSIKGTGFDYWLGYPDDILFQKKARLEVSGIYDGDEIALEKRFATKSKQTDVSDSSRLPAYVSVTAFKQPQTKFAKKI